MGKKDGLNSRGDWLTSNHYWRHSDWVEKIRILLFGANFDLQRLVRADEKDENRCNIVKRDNLVRVGVVPLGCVLRTLHPHIQAHRWKPRQPQTVYSLSNLFNNLRNYLPARAVLRSASLLDEYVCWVNKICRSSVLWGLVECERFRRLLPQVEHYCSRIPLLLRFLRCNQIYQRLNLPQLSQVFSFLYFGLVTRNHSHVFLRVLLPRSFIDVWRTGSNLHLDQVWKWTLHRNNFLVTYARRLWPLDGADKQRVLCKAVTIRTFMH